MKYTRETKTVEKRLPNVGDIWTHDLADINRSVYMRVEDYRGELACSRECSGKNNIYSVNLATGYLVFSEKTANFFVLVPKTPIVFVAAE